MGGMILARPQRPGTPALAPFPDEDRLSKRKSIGETISLQVEVESRNSPEKEEVSVLSLTHCPGEAQCPQGRGPAPATCAVRHSMLQDLEELTPQDAVPFLMVTLPIKGLDGNVGGTSARSEEDAHLGGTWTRRPCGVRGWGHFCPLGPVWPWRTA